MRRGSVVSMSLGSRSLYPFVLAAMCERPREERARVRVLDFPAGDGALSFALAAAGFDVVGADLFPETFGSGRTAAGLESKAGAAALFERMARCRLPGWLVERAFGGEVPARTDVPCVAADLEAGEGSWPAPGLEGLFDVVVCVEGIEHVVDRHRTLRNLRRLLRPGGRLLLTTPNLLSLRARLASCFAGQRAFKSFIDEHTSVWGRSDDGRRIYHGHAFLINYFQLRYSLHHCGLRIERLWPSNWSPSSLMLAPMVPLVWLAHRASERSARRAFVRGQARGTIDAGARPPFDEIRRHVLSPEMLFNATMIVEASAR